MGNVTMREIGRRIGVSAVTVSKALAGRSGVSEEMRARIVTLADELGYVNPNTVVPHARSLDVGILIPDHFFSPESYYAMLYKLLVQELTDQGHFGMLELLSAETEQKRLLPNVLRSGRADALILLGQPDDNYVRMLCEQPIPVVFLDFYDERAGASAVVGDNGYGCYRLTSHLIRAGHRDIGFVGNRLATSSIMDRFLGYFRAMIMNGLPIREEWLVSDRQDDGVVYSTIELPEKLPTAFVCNCDLIARRTIEALQVRGLRVPEDVSVTGFDDFPEQASELPLTTFRMNSHEMVQMAVKLVSDHCAGQTGISRMVISGHPIYRDSDGPVKT